MSATAQTLARVHRLSVADYHRMGETGILGPELRTELIDGEIIEMPPIGHPHAGTVKLLANLLKEAVGSAAVLAVQDPIWLNDHSEPLPDCRCGCRRSLRALLRRRRRSRTSHDVPRASPCGILDLLFAAIERKLIRG